MRTEGTSPIVSRRVITGQGSLSEKAQFRLGGTARSRSGDESSGTDKISKTWISPEFTLPVSQKGSEPTSN